jgi:annexin A7/11
MQENDTNEDQNLKKKSTHLEGSKHVTFGSTHIFEPKTSTSIEVQALHDALNSIIVDSKSIIAIVAGSDSYHRREIVDFYPVQYGQDLLRKTGKKLQRGLFRQVVTGSLMPLPEFYASQIHDTFGIFSNDWNSLVDMLVTIEPSVLSETNKAYVKVYKTSMESDIKWNIKCGHYQLLIILLALNRRSRNTEIDEDLVNLDIDDLFNKDEGKIKANSYKFVETMALRSKTHLLCLFERCEAYTGSGIHAMIQLKFSGVLQKALHKLVKIVQDFDGTRAEELYNCLMGPSSVRKHLVRFAITLAESPQLNSIKLLYQVYHTNLVNYSNMPE